MRSQTSLGFEVCVCVCVFGGGAPGLTVCCGSGFQALVLTALLVTLGVLAGLPLEELAEMLLPLAFVATLTAFIFSLLLYLKALLAPTSALAPGGNSGETGPSRVRMEEDQGACLQLHPLLFSRQSHL